jgi:hypothetical protein
MSHSYTELFIDFCWWWYTDAAPVVDAPKEF